MSFLCIAILFFFDGVKNTCFKKDFVFMQNAENQ